MRDKKNRKKVSKQITVSTVAAEAEIQLKTGLQLHEGHRQGQFALK